MEQSTSSSRLLRPTRRLFATLVVAGVALVACGDDDDSGPARATHEEWFEAACALVGNLDPGFDAFFEAHPEPALADWAEFLPTPIAALDQIIVAANLPHPVEDDADLAEIVVVVSKVQDTFRASIDAAKAGDQAAFDALEAQAQNVDGPAMQEVLDRGEQCPGSGD